jgi:hypothetical protein
VKQRVDEFKHQKKEEEDVRKLEEELWERAQKEQQKQLAAKELVKFRERVGFEHLIFSLQ